MFPRMAAILPERTVGSASISHREVTENESRWSAVRRSDGGYCPAGTYAVLTVDGSLVMSDTRTERYSNSAVVDHAHGRVLIAGLGLGMILHPILAKPDVESVTVIEKCADVITLVTPTLDSDKLTIIQADIFEWRPGRGTTFNTIYFDIWSDICTSNIEQINTLHRRGCRWLDKSDSGAWMDSWMSSSLRAERRKEARSCAW